MTDTRLTSSATRADGASPVLAVQNLSVSFRGRSGENQALKGISFAIYPAKLSPWWARAAQVNQSRRWP